MRTSLVTFLTGAAFAGSLLIAGIDQAATAHAGSQIAPASRTVTARFLPLAGSKVSGSATLTALGGATRVSWHVKGFAPGASLRSSLFAGTCARPSASFRYLATLTADARGRATATATTTLPLSLLADGDHIIAIRGAACGSIPTLR